MMPTDLVALIHTVIDSNIYVWPMEWSGRVLLGARGGGNDSPKDPSHKTPRPRREPEEVGLRWAQDQYRDSLPSLGSHRAL